MAVGGDEPRDGLPVEGVDAGGGDGASWARRCRSGMWACSLLASGEALVGIYVDDVLWDGDPAARSQILRATVLRLAPRGGSASRAASDREAVRSAWKGPAPSPCGSKGLCLHARLRPHATGWLSQRQAAR